MAKVDIQNLLQIMAKRPQDPRINRQMPVMEDVNVDLQAPNGANVDANVMATPAAVDETVVETPPNIVRKPGGWANGENPGFAGGRPPIEDAYNQAQTRYINAVNKPITKQPLWKDILAAGIQTLDNWANRKSTPVKLWGTLQHDKEVDAAGRALAPLDALYKSEQDKRLRAANINIAEGKPELANIKSRQDQEKIDLAEFKAINDADYKRNLIRLGDSKAKEVADNNLRIFELRKRGLDQNDKRIQILEERNAEIMRHNQVTEDTNREKGKPKNNVPLSPPSVTVPSGKKNPKDPMGLFK